MNALFAAALGFGITAYVMPKFRPRILRIKLCPPVAWLQASDPKTVNSVATAVSVAFKMAKSRSSPGPRTDALRQATFAVPHEIARLNKIPGSKFHLKEMGPCRDLDADRLNFIVSTTGFKPTFDVKEDTQVSLYYPSKDATKATAVFVAINAEGQIPQHGPAAPGATNLKTLIQYATALWNNHYELWTAEDPDLKNSFEPGPLHIIFSFQDKTCGGLYNQETSQFETGSPLEVVIGLVDLLDASAPRPNR